MDKSSEFAQDFPVLALKSSILGSPSVSGKPRQLVTLGAVVFGNRAKCKYGLCLLPAT